MSSVLVLKGVFLQDLTQQLKEFRIKKGLSQSEIAKKLNIPQTTWSGYERGRSRPTMGVLIELERLGFKFFKTVFESAAEEAGLSLEEAKARMDVLPYLPVDDDTDIAEAGRLAKEFANSEYIIFKYNKFAPRAVVTDKNDPAAVVLLPLYSQKAAAGKGEKPTQLGAVDSYLPVVMQLLRGASPKTCGVLRVKGDSMTDIGLYDGDYAIFDTKQTEGDGVYVITVNGLTRVKRLENRVIEKKIIISSENARRYPNPEELTYEQASEVLTIHGKVIGWIHSHFY